MNPQHDRLAFSIDAEPLLFPDEVGGDRRSVGIVLQLRKADVVQIDIAVAGGEQMQINMFRPRRSRRRHLNQPVFAAVERHRSGIQLWSRELAEPLHLHQPRPLALHLRAQPVGSARRDFPEIDRDPAVAGQLHRADAPVRLLPGIVVPEAAGRIHIAAADVSGTGQRFFKVEQRRVLLRRDRLHIDIVDVHRTAFFREKEQIGVVRPRRSRRGKRKPPVGLSQLQRARFGADDPVAVAPLHLRRRRPGTFHERAQPVAALRRRFLEIDGDPSVAGELHRPDAVPRLLAGVVIPESPGRIHEVRPDPARLAHRRFKIQQHRIGFNRQRLHRNIVEQHLAAFGRIEDQINVLHPRRSLAGHIDPGIFPRQRQGGTVGTQHLMLIPEPQQFRLRRPGTFRKRAQPVTLSSLRLPVVHRQAAVAGQRQRPLAGACVLSAAVIPEISGRIHVNLPRRPRLQQRLFKIERPRPRRNPGEAAQRQTISKNRIHRNTLSNVSHNRRGC